VSNIGFDPKGFYEFDLARGAVSTRGGARVIVLSDTVVASLVSAAVETGDLTVLRELGKQIGAQVVASLGGAVFDDSPEQVLAHTSGWLGVLGWGRLGFERWGQALVAVMEGVPALDEDSLGIAALLGGRHLVALQAGGRVRAGGRQVPGVQPRHRRVRLALGQ
jgi:hypothetical protein